MEPLALYVHWPFCAAKCPYCDFNSHVRDGVDHISWRAALLRELDHYADLTAGRTVTSIFFGGGTPSLMAPEAVARIVEEARRLFAPSGPIEVTLEANPTDAEAGRFAALAQAGVNRLSMGVQALDDASLRFLGRNHSAGEAIRAVENGRTRFVPRQWESTYFEWMRNIQPWCISRQIWWGHQIPAWYGPDGKVFVAEAMGWEKFPAPVSLAITGGSLLFNTMAGYAFAKLRFAGRERLFQLLLAALVAEYDAGLRERRYKGNPGIAAGLVLRAAGVDEHTAAAAYLMQMASSMTQNAIRAIPLGQDAGQRILIDVYEYLPGFAEETLTHDVPDLGVSFPRLEIAQMQHQYMRSRMFMS